MGESKKKIGGSKRRILVIVAILVVLIAGASAAYFFYVAPMMKANETSSTNNESGSSITVATIKPEQQKSLDSTKSEIESLIAKGDTQSLGKADEAAKSQVQIANDSGNNGYIIMAELARAKLLIDTSRAQEALDTILFPLLEKYGSNGVYANEIYVSISLAYLSLGNTDKSDEYINQASGRGGQ